LGLFCGTHLIVSLIIIIIQFRLYDMPLLNNGAGKTSYIYIAMYIFYSSQLLSSTRVNRTIKGYRHSSFREFIL